MSKAENKQEDSRPISQVNHPVHYNQGSIECIEAMVAAYGWREVFIFCKINAFKYLWRTEHKGPAMQDLDKAKWYLDYCTKLYEENKESTDKD